MIRHRLSIHAYRLSSACLISMHVSKLLCAILKIFCHFSGWESLQYRTFRVAITFSIWLGFRNNSNGMHSLRLPCKLLKPHLYDYACYNIVGLLELHFLLSQDSISISSCPRKEEKMRILTHSSCTCLYFTLQCSITLKSFLSNVFVFTFPLLSLLPLSTK